MTSETSVALAKCRDVGRPALIGYLPLGFPNLRRSVEAIKTMMDAGVDIVELGIPYTDPVMDGPVIQAAATAALASGVRVADVFDVIAELRAYRPDVPILVMTYYNLVLRYGVDQFARDLAEAGGAGLITPDLIPDEAASWLRASDRYDLDRVFLVAPSSTPERLALTAAASRGFVYAASTMGVTGVRAQVGPQAEQLVAATRDAGAEFVCVGLGVSTAKQAAQVGKYADGVIVGSALVKPLLGSGLTEAANKPLLGSGLTEAANKPLLSTPFRDGSESRYGDTVHEHGTDPSRNPTPRRPADLDAQALLADAFPEAAAGAPDRVPDAVWQQRLADLRSVTSELAVGVAAARQER